MQKRHRRLLRGFVGVCVGLVTCINARGATPTGAVLFPLNPIAGYFIEPIFVASGQAVGLFVGPGSNPNHAALWTATGPVDLNPSQFGNSLAFANSGNQQVGYGSASPTSTVTSALLWTGSAASAINLSPTTTGITSSALEGTDGTQQVGYALGTATGNLAHAYIWSNTVASAVDIHPTNITGITGSQAVATDGTQQVGNCQGPGTSNQASAVMWSGSANTAVLLNPTNITGYTQSFALGVAGKQQVGWGFNAPLDRDRALLWTGSAASTVDLTPTGLGFDDGEANGTNGQLQVGDASVGSNPGHAMLWSGTANSAIDLQTYLPAGTWTDSEAYSIDANDNVYGIADGTYNGVTGAFAVEWIVPEPSSVFLFAFSGILFLRRNFPSKILHERIAS